MAADELRIGWAQVDLTPDEPVYLGGQHYARASEGVLDRLSATAMVYESIQGNQVVARGGMVSCDLAAIPDTLRDRVRDQLSQQFPGQFPGQLPGLDPRSVFINATHTHAAPDVRVAADQGSGTGRERPKGLDQQLGVMTPEAYVTFAAQRISHAVVQAWEKRSRAGISYGLGHAVVGYNRRMVYHNGQTRMRGKMNHPDFSHIEGGADHTVNLLYTWNAEEQLTGVVVNVVCPSQVSEREFSISADYWHEVRQEIHRTLGQEVFVLPQNSASGDICPGHPRTMIEWPGQERMWRLMGITQRQAIGRRIAQVVTDVLSIAQLEKDWRPVVAQGVEEVQLTRNPVSQQQVDEAMAQAEQCRLEYEKLLAELDADPKKREEARWYVPMTLAHGKMGWHQRTQTRFEEQRQKAKLTVEVHILRLGDVVFATNPFELYLDYAHQIKARSAATQTFIVQHVGPGTYLPTQRALGGKSYGAEPSSVLVGPQGGRELVDATVQAINLQWATSKPSGEM